MRGKNYTETGSHQEYGGKRYSDSVPARENVEGADFATLPGGTSDSSKWKLGGCPRCRGDVFLDSEDGVLLGHCLQCGYVGARSAAPAPRPISDG